jgi:hypothetical protein
VGFSFAQHETKEVTNMQALISEVEGATRSTERRVNEVTTGVANEQRPEVTPPTGEEWQPKTVRTRTEQPARYGWKARDVLVGVVELLLGSGLDVPVNRALQENPTLGTYQRFP